MHRADALPSRGASRAPRRRPRLQSDALFWRSDWDLARQGRTEADVTRLAEARKLNYRARLVAIAGACRGAATDDRGGASSFSVSSPGLHSTSLFSVFVCCPSDSLPAVSRYSLASFDIASPSVAGFLFCLTVGASSIERIQRFFEIKQIAPILIWNAMQLARSQRKDHDRARAIFTSLIAEGASCRSSFAMGQCRTEGSMRRISGGPPTTATILSIAYGITRPRVFVAINVYRRRISNKLGSRLLSFVRNAPHIL